MAVAKKAKSPRGAKPPEEMLALPQRLRRAMERADDITQTALAAAAGVSQTTVSNMTTGASLEGVSVAALARVAKILNVSLDYLVMGKDDTIPRLVDTARATGRAVVIEQSEHPLVPPLTQPRLRKRQRRRTSHIP